MRFVYNLTMKFLKWLGYIINSNEMNVRMKMIRLKLVRSQDVQTNKIPAGNPWLV